MTGPRTFTFLGTGTSIGVPVIGCPCSVCASTNPRNHRYRSSVLIGTPKGNLLIDTSPEMRLQLLREKVRLIHAVVYTHYHADHLFGLDDLRIIGHYLNAPVPIYCTEDVEEVIRKAFFYAFLTSRELPSGAVPKLEFNRIDEQPFEVLGQHVTPIPLMHNWYRVFGYRIADVAYCTDVSEIPETSWPLLEGVRIFVIDALRYKKHPAHFGLNEALEAIERVAPEKAYLTHMSHEFDYEELQPKLPAGVEMAYDGLSFIF
jgi:phosphoribosyl 1,2-cyclic phosphate phosphodiesterase